MEWKPLKVYGSVIETSSSFVATFKGKKRIFPFKRANEEERKRTRLHVQQHLSEKTTETKYVNMYMIDNGVVSVTLRADNSSTTVDYTLQIDEQDLEKIKGKVWYARTTQNNVSQIYYTYSEKGSKSRVYLCVRLFGTTRILHKDGNILNNCRTNIQFLDGRQASVDSKVRKSSFSSFPSLPLAETARETREVGTVPDDFDRFCFPNGPVIPKHIWSACKVDARTASRKLILLQALEKSFCKHYDEFPLHVYSDAELMATADRLAVSCYKGKNNLLSRNDAGQALCKHFMLPVMMLCEYRNNGKSMSAAKFWRSPKGKEQVFSSALRQSSPVLSSKSLLAALQFTHYVPSNFRPTAAKTIYELFGGNGRVLDLCSGYGGRFLGFWFAKNTVEYVGIDPNKHLQTPYRLLSTWLEKRYPKDKKYCFLQGGAETDTIAHELDKQEKFDLVFTSPPYFDCEIYDPEDVTQSCNSFSQSYSSWLDGFLYKALNNGYNRLNSGGVMAINVADGKRCPSIVQDTKTYMTARLGLKFEKTMNLVIPRKPGVQKDNFEPIMIFRKQ